MASLLVNSEEELTEIHQDNEEHSKTHRQSPTWRFREYLPFRLLRVLLNDPAICVFIISLILVSICMPLLGLYLKNSDNLLDLDTMKIWNKFIGKLYQKHFSVPGPLNNSLSTLHIPCDGKLFNCDVVGVKLYFDVGKDIFKNHNISVLAGNFSGTNMSTIITDTGGKRIDNAINLHIMLDINKSRNGCLASGHCRVQGCVLITAPTNSSGFNNLLHPSPSYRKPSDDIVCNKTELSHYYRNLTAVHTMKLSRFKSAVKTSGTHIRKHGLILIYISKEDQEIAAHRIYKASVVFVGLALAILIGLSCTGNQNNTEQQTNRHNE